ncbi:MAG: hypothetical protein KDB14_30790 [Planctomycetales bacterium]|nr:hypothetical protein [Planctomycetales bacterium]
MAPNQHQLLDEIDARQDAVLQELDELNLRIESTIQQILEERKAAEEGQTSPPSQATLVSPGGPAEHQDTAAKAA